MRILAFIEDEEVIKKILKHMGLWDQKARPPPKANARSMAQQYHMEYNESQVPPCEVYPPIFGGIISTVILNIQLRHMLHDFFKNGQKI